VDALTAAPTATTEVRWRDRQRRFFVGVPFALLAIVTVGVLLSGESRLSTPMLLGFVGALAAWEAACWTRPSLQRESGGAVGRPAQSRGQHVRAGEGRTAVYIVGVLVLGTALIHAQGLYAFVIWPYIVRIYEVLGGARRWAALVMTAALISWAQLGSPTRVEPGIVAAGLGLLLKNGGLIVAMVKFGEVTERHDLQRRQAVTALEATNLELEVALAQVTGLQSQLVAQAREAGVAAERERFAGEVHDTIAQGLAGVATQLEASEVATSDADRRHHLAQAKDIARRALGEARRSLRAVGPERLEQARLPAAVRGVAHTWSETTGITASVEVTGEARQLVADADIALYRAVQEALANVAKHASASRAVVTLSYTDDEVLLDVRDDGRGLARSDASEATVPPGRVDGTGFGLRFMRQRVAAVGGSVALKSGSGEGTTLTVTVPTAFGTGVGHAVREVAPCA
jgi:signal transduction histidine kinase